VASILITLISGLGIINAMNLVDGIFDTLRVFWIRILRKQSPFHADKLHLHHLLLKAGFSHKKATLTLVLANLFFIVVSFTLQLFTANIIYILLVLLALCFIMTEVFEHLKRANGKVNE
jgi:UDP-GlcNAc:undecaprenyl-phosphate GlcNAc-1-phosphate transferase